MARTTWTKRVAITTLVTMRMNRMGIQTGAIGSDGVVEQYRQAHGVLATGLIPSMMHVVNSHVLAKYRDRRHSREKEQYQRVVRSVHMKSIMRKSHAVARRHVLPPRVKLHGVPTRMTTIAHVRLAPPCPCPMRQPVPFHTPRHARPVISMMIRVHDHLVAADEDGVVYLHFSVGVRSALL
jgi:hypothetical protein